MEMVWLAFIGGLILGWLIEWVIDWQFWRKNVESLRQENQRLRTQLDAAQRQLAASQSSAATQLPAPAAEPVAEPVPVDEPTPAEAVAIPTGPALAEPALAEPAPGHAEPPAGQQATRTGE